MLWIRTGTMALTQAEQAGWGRDHAGLFDRFASGWQPLRALPEPRAGWVYVGLPVRPSGGHGDFCAGALRQLHTPAAVARHHLHCDRNGNCALSVHAAVVVCGPVATSGQAVLAGVREPLREGHLLSR